MLKKIEIILFISFIALLFPVITYSAEIDVVADSYAAAATPSLNSCTSGYNVMAGDVEYQKTIITGSLPYALNYRAPLRQNNAAFFHTFERSEQTTNGWSDNYTSYLITKRIRVRVAHPNYAVNEIKYHIVRLPGETEDKIFSEKIINGVSSFKVMSNPGYVNWLQPDDKLVASILDEYDVTINNNTDIGGDSGYKMIRNGAILSVSRYGQVYNFKEQYFTLSPITKKTYFSLELYLEYGYKANYGFQGPNIDFFKKEYHENEFGQNLKILRYNVLSEVETEVETVFTRAANVTYSNGTTLFFDYDNNLNLIRVADNRNNVLKIKREYGAGALSSQNIYESRLVTGVELVSGTVGDGQSAILEYESFDSKIILTGETRKTYALAKVSATTISDLNFEYKSTEIGSTKKLLAKYSKDPYSQTYNHPVLNILRGKNSIILRQWDVYQLYTYSSDTGKYSTADTTIKSFAVENGSPIGKTETYYNDLSGGINFKILLDSDRQVTGRIYPADNSDFGVIYRVEDYPCLTIGKTPVQYIQINTYNNNIDYFCDKKDQCIYYRYDSSSRLKRISAPYMDDGVEKSKDINYTYGNLEDQSPNLFNVPSTVQIGNWEYSSNSNYDGNTHVISGSGVTVTNVINTRGQVKYSTVSSTQSGSQDRLTKYSYYEDSNLANFGLLYMVDGPLAGTTDRVRYYYDDYGNLAKKRMDLNGIARNTFYVGYNSKGDPERVVNPEGIVNKFIYNTDGTLKIKIVGVGNTVSAVSGKTISYTYDDFQRVKTETNPDGETISYEYDVIGQVTKIINPDGSVNRKRYYSMGLLKSDELLDASESLIFNAVYQFIDDNGRISGVQNGTNAGWYSKNYEYDVNGNLEKLTDGGAVSRWTYDELNRVKTHTDPLGYVDRKKYDVFDNVISSTDPIGSGSVPIEFKNKNVITKETNNDFGVKEYFYNTGDQLTSATHGVRLCDYTPDELERNQQVVCKAKDGSSVSPTLVYDDTFSFDQTRFGRLDSVASASAYGANTTYTYDAYDRIIAKSQFNKSLTTWNVANSSALTVGYDYTLGDKLKSLTLPSGKQVSYIYDATGHLTDVQLNGQPLLRGVIYNDGGQLASWKWGTGNASYTLTYDTSKNGSIKNIVSKSAAGATIYSLSYGFYSNGNIKRILRNDGSNNNFTYFSNNWLKTENGMNGTDVVYSTGYTYDQNGNRKTLTATGTPPDGITAATYEYTGNKLTSYVKNGVSQTVSYKTNAELAFADRNPIYDFAGRRKRELETSVSRFFAYNHKNERTLKSNDNGAWASNTIQYVYDESSHLIGEYDRNGNALVEYIWLGDKPVVAIYPTGIYYVVTDSSNTPHRLMNMSNDQIVWAWDGSAFGTGVPTIQTVTFNLRFPGQYYDADSGQHYNLNRFYNPELGRYMEPDPIGLEGGLNPYAYAGNNPVNMVDPDAKHPRRAMYEFLEPTTAYFLRAFNPVRVAGLAPRMAPKTVAVGRVAGMVFTDVNQGARPLVLANSNQPTLIADRALARLEKRPLSGLTNSSMLDAHAEIGVIEQAYRAGKTQGQSMFMGLSRPPCGYCTGDLAAEAERAGLSYLRINTVNTRTLYPEAYYWMPGMKRIERIGVIESIEQIPYSWAGLKANLW